MAAGVTDRLWSVEDLVALWQAYERRRPERAAYVSDLTTITQDFLAECHEDHVGLWSLVKRT
jgi:hypothetical protein